MAIEPITAEQADDFNAWLQAHGMMKAGARKRIRVYRKTFNSANKVRHSRDFVYVVSADDYRNDLDNVHAKLIELSQKVMDPEEVVKSEEYLQTMNAVERDLLMNHQVQMNWYNGKSANFKYIRHVITDPEILEELNEAIKHHKNFDEHNPYLERFRCGALIAEFGVCPQYDWKKFNIIVENGKVICAYSTEDLVPISKEKFKTGFFDKFGYNIDICSEDNIKNVLEHVKRQKEVDIQLAMAEAN